MGVYSAGGPAIGSIPHRGQKGGSTQSRPPTLQKAGQQVKLGDGQIDLLSSDESLAGLRVERNSRTLENLCCVNHVQIPRRENEDMSTSSDEQQQNVN